MHEALTLMLPPDLSEPWGSRRVSYHTRSTKIPRAQTEMSQNRSKSVLINVLINDESCWKTQELQTRRAEWVWVVKWRNKFIWSRISLFFTHFPFYAYQRVKPRDSRASGADQGGAVWGEGRWRVAGCLYRGGRYTRRFQRSRRGGKPGVDMKNWSAGASVGQFSSEAFCESPSAELRQLRKTGSVLPLRCCKQWEEPPDTPHPLTKRHSENSKSKWLESSEITQLYCLLLPCINWRPPLFVSQTKKTNNSRDHV